MKRMPILSLLLVFTGVLSFAMSTMGAVHWQHPAGLVTNETIAEVKAKIEAHDWARNAYEAQKKSHARWVNIPFEKLKRVFPTKRGNVYHNYSCPHDRCKLTFEPFQPDEFKCPSCGRTYPPQTNAGIYEPDSRYHGTMYDGWVCHFYLTSSAVVADLGLMARLKGEEAYYKRGIEILQLYADTIEHLKIKPDSSPHMCVLLTYHREGDSTVLRNLASAYELLRDRMTRDQQVRFERIVLKRMLDDIMLEPIYTMDWNNVYWWHLTITQTALALERDDLIDWCFGYGRCAPENEPEHRSIRYLAANHFKPDGAFWEMCSGYHLYPLHPFCELAVLSRNLVRMDPARFPASKYDLTDPMSPGGKAIHAALTWFMSLAMPDRTMPTIGDSMKSRAGMDDYYATAEVGYRYFDIKAVGDYEKYRRGQRDWSALIYGAPQIVRHDMPYTSSCLSSGWVSLRNEWQGNRVWVGLNAFIPGGGHQHADRLTFLSYSHGKLLALEKATPYNEQVTRKLGTLSQSHNTVTVDKNSQKQGENLLDKENPRTAFFFAGPVAKFAELHADNLYPQTDVYRRSVALIEDIMVDVFSVRGGTTHDWMVHHAGSAPHFSVPMSKGTFSPAEWLANGTNNVLHAVTNHAWEARWTVDEVQSRLTMLGGQATEIYALETYPIDNAVVTADCPPCQTLCVCHDNNASPFLAIWDAWRDSPNMKQVSQGTAEKSIMLRSSSNTYYLLFGPGQTRYEDGVSMKSDAAFSIWRKNDAAEFVGGTQLEIQTPGAELLITVDRLATLSAEYANGTVTLETAGNIHYDTYDGRNHYRPAPETAVRLEGNMWAIRKRQHRSTVSSSGLMEH